MKYPQLPTFLFLFVLEGACITGMDLEGVEINVFLWTVAVVAAGIAAFWIGDKE